MWQGEALVAVGALKLLAPNHGEVKSMHTAEAMRGTGAGSAMLRHIMTEARARGCSRLSRSEQHLHVARPPGVLT